MSISSVTCSSTLHPGDCAIHGCLLYICFRNVGNWTFLTLNLAPQTPPSGKIPVQSNFPTWQEAVFWADVGGQFGPRGASTASPTHMGPWPQSPPTGSVLPPLPSKPFLWLPATRGRAAFVSLTFPFLPFQISALLSALPSSQAPSHPFLVLSALSGDYNNLDSLANSCLIP